MDAEPRSPTAPHPAVREMMAEYAERQAWLSRVNRSSWAAALFILVLLVVATIGLGRLHLAYLLCSLVALATRALPVIAEYHAVVPGFLCEPRFRGDALRGARQEAHEAMREGYLEALLVSAGKWRNEEARRAMALEEVEAIVDGLDLGMRRRAYRVALVVWGVLAVGFVVTMGVLEVAYRRGTLHTEGGVLRGLFGG